MGEGSGISGVAVKCVENRKEPPVAKAATWPILTLRHESVGSKQGLDTLVVHAVNDVTSCWLYEEITSGAANAIS